MFVKHISRAATHIHTKTPLFSLIFQHSDLPLLPIHIFYNFIQYSIDSCVLCVCMLLKKKKYAKKRVEDLLKYVHKNYNIKYTKSQSSSSYSVGVYLPIILKQKKKQTNKFIWTNSI